MMWAPHSLLVHRVADRSRRSLRLRSRFQSTHWCCEHTPCCRELPVKHVRAQVLDIGVIFFLILFVCKNGPFGFPHVFTFVTQWHSVLQERFNHRAGCDVVKYYVCVYLLLHMYAVVNVSSMYESTFCSQFLIFYVHLFMFCQNFHLVPLTLGVYMF